MSVTISTTNKPLNPRAQDLSPKGYNRASLYSGKALDFDGVNDYVDLDGFTMAGTTATISFYYKSDSNKALAYIFDNNQRWVIGQADTTNSFGFYDGSTWRKSTQTLTLGEWYHITAVINGGDVEFLWNGQSVGDTFTGANPISWASLTTFKLGWSYNASGGIGQINGQIAGFKIFNTALTAAQVSDLYLNPEKIVPDGVANSALKLWLPMMEGAGTTAYDGSGNGNHGTINGATWVSGVGAPVAQTALVGWNKGTNLITYSQALTTNWVNAGGTFTTNNQTGPDGVANSASTFTHSNANSRYQTFTGVSGQAFTFSIYVKGDVAHDAFITAGVIGSLTNYNFSVTTEWQRFTMTVTPAATNCVVGIYASTNPTVRTIHIYGAQVTQTSDVQPYVETLATAQTSPVLLPQGLTANKDITGVNSVSRNAYALNLDGASWAEVHDNASLDITGYITLEAWVEIKDGMVADGILGRWTSSLGYLLYLNSSTDVRFYVEGLDVRYTSLTNGWHHIVGVYDGTKKRIYVDGVERNLSNQTTGASASNNPIEIGRYQQSTGNAFDNQIALPRIYNRALTATEVARNYNADKSKFGL